MEPCPANVYIDYMLSWVQEELDDENIFPSQIGMEFFRIPILLGNKKGHAWFVLTDLVQNSSGN